MTDNNRVWKVTHAKDGVETVYLVTAIGRRDAETRVLDTLYDRHFFRPETAERLANDPFGLIHAGQNGEYTNVAVCKRNGCTISSVPWVADEPYRLYAIDTRTGVMS